MKIKPVPGKVLIQAIIPPDVSTGGILLPTDREGDPKDHPQYGTVLLVGEGMQNKWGHTVPMPCKPGQKIIFCDSWSTESKEMNITDGRMFVDQEDILAVYED